MAMAIRAIPRASRNPTAARVQALTILAPMVLAPTVLAPTVLALTALALTALALRVTRPYRLTSRYFSTYSTAAKYKNS